MDDWDKAREQWDTSFEKVEDDLWRRWLHNWMAFSYTDEGTYDKAIEEANKAYNLAIQLKDSLRIAGSLNTISMILRTAGRLDEAEAKQNERWEFNKNRNLPKADKVTFHSDLLWNQVNFAYLRGDLQAAKKIANEYLELDMEGDPEKSENYQKILGVLALFEKRCDEAINIFAKQINPYGLYRLAKAYECKGDMEKAKEIWTRLVNYNEINFSLCFVRKEAKERLAAI